MGLFSEDASDALDNIKKALVRMAVELFKVNKRTAQSMIKKPKKIKNPVVKQQVMVMHELYKELKPAKKFLITLQKLVRHFKGSIKFHDDWRTLKHKLVRATNNLSSLHCAPRELSTRKSNLNRINKIMLEINRRTQG